MGGKFPSAKWFTRPDATPNPIATTASTTIENHMAIEFYGVGVVPAFMSTLPTVLPTIATITTTAENTSRRTTATRFVLVRARAFASSAEQRGNIGGRTDGAQRQRQYNGDTCSTSR